MIRNIAFIHCDFPAGGAERITVDLGGALAEKGAGYRIFALTKCVHEDKVTDSMAKAVTIVQMPSEDDEYYRYLANVVAGKHIDVVVQVGHHDEKGMRIARQNGCTTVCCAYHGKPFWEEEAIISDVSGRSSHDSVKLIQWMLFRRFKYVILGKAKREASRRVRQLYDGCDKFIVLCDSYKQSIVKRLKLSEKDNKIVVIENSERPVKEVCLNKRKQFLYAGRLSYFDKRVDRLLKIWKRVYRKLPEWELVIAGDGLERTNLECMARRLRLGNYQFIGWRNDTSECFKEASVLCMTSSVEGWPLALTEAQANGVVPVAFDVSGGIEAILSPSGQNGFLIRPFDIKKYADTLLRIANMDALELNRLRHNVIEKAKEYSPDKTVVKWLDLFDGLVYEK